MAERVGLAERIMEAFGQRTGLESTAPPRRYLWTDAFAVCAYLALHRRTSAPRWMERARALVAQVHEVLGRHRGDDGRTGWISGLDDTAGRHHPTIGGLRIGKPFPERRPDDPLDEALEWDRDGQYYHYLTRWMHALVCLHEETGDPEPLRHGAELAAASDAFVHSVGGVTRLHWKMSIDLSRPLVPSMGQHDPLDGLVAVARLQAAIAAHGPAADDRGPAGPDLTMTARPLASLCRGRSWATMDALGIGGLLMDAWFLARLPRSHPSVRPDLLPAVLGDAARSLALVTVGAYLMGPAAHRIPFRELGLALGLAAVPRLQALREEGGVPGGDASARALDALADHVALRDRIEAFWLNPENQTAPTWIEHEDINAVMLASSLLPEGWLG
jgi:hypothetical protein